MVLALLIYEEKMWIVLVTCSAHQNVHRNIGKPNEYQKKCKNWRKVSNVQFLVKRCVEFLPRNQDQHERFKLKIGLQNN